MPTADLTLASLTSDKNKHLQGVSKNGVIGAIRQAAARTGVDFAYLLDKAAQESSFNPGAKSTTSSATGLYQFIGQTWLRMIKEHGAEYGLQKEAAAISIDKNGNAKVEDRMMREKILNLRYDPVMSSAMAAEFTRENKDYLDAKLGGEIGSTELYLAHFLGAGGAEKFLKNMKAAPHASAADILPDAAEANRSVFYGKDGRALSFAQIYNRFAAKFKGGGGEGDEAALMAQADASGATPGKLLLRDLSSLSSSFYVPPAEIAPVLNMWKQNGTTSETLFSVMTLAQMHINTALTGAVSEAAKDDARSRNS